MLVHIVKQGETLRKICDAYHVLREDIISHNQHITDFDRLVSGTKIRIPLLSKDVLETLEETESFIEDYYPSFDKFVSMSKTMNETPKVEEHELPEEIEVIPPVEPEINAPKVVPNKKEEPKPVPKVDPNKTEELKTVPKVPKKIELKPENIVKQEQKPKAEYRIRTHADDIFFYPLPPYYGNVSTLPYYRPEHIRKI